jgi:type I restriction enzyme S subunit
LPLGLIGEIIVSKLLKECPFCNEDYLLLMKPSSEEERLFVEQLWLEYEEYADANYIEEFPRQLHRRFWEMYLACSLLYKRHKLCPRERDIGPDTCVEIHGGRIWLEATAPGPGTGPDALVESKCRDKMAYVPEEKVVLRYRSAIESKIGKWREYVEKEIIDAKGPYIVALNGREIPGAWPDDDEIPLIIRTVFPFGDPFAVYDLQDHASVQGGILYQDKIIKRSGAQVLTDIFFSKEYSGISGVLFSNVNLWHYPRKLGSDFLFIHNYRSKNPVPLGWLGLGIEFWWEEDGLHRELSGNLTCISED